MVATPQELQDQDEAFLKQAAADKANQQQKEIQAKQPPSFLSQWVTGPIGRVTHSMIDSAVSAADAIYDTPGMRKARDVTAGAITGATNIADAAVSFGRSAYAANTDSTEDVAKRTLSGEAAPAPPTSPIWDHAKSAILDFRDAVAVQDPSLADNLVQGAAQLALPFAGYSRALAGLHGFANVAAAGAATDATALMPHDMRMADLVALGKHTEGKLGEALRWLGPKGLDAYVNFLADRTNESEAEGRFKNALDGLGVNAIATPLLHAAGVVLKQGTAGLRYAVANGIGSAGDLAPASAKSQAGKIGWHGSPQSDLTELRPGDKLAARGHGIYLSEDPGVARSYVPKSGGGLYSVDVPDEHVANMMHWDESLSTQPAARKFFEQQGIAGDMSAGEAYRELSAKLRPQASPDKPLSWSNVEADTSGDKAASRALLKAGIPGIKYPASGKYSSGGSGAHNLVLFDPEHAKVVSKEK